MQINNRRVISFAIAATVLVAGIVFAVRYFSGHSLVVVSDQRPITVVINERSYIIQDEEQSIRLKDVVNFYRATNEDGFTFSGVLNMQNESDTVLKLNFTKYSISEIHKSVCSKDRDIATFCSSNAENLSVEYVSNNQWALIKSPSDLYEAVHMVNKDWQFVPITQSDIISGQYPKGLEKAAREYE